MKQYKQYNTEINNIIKYYIFHGCGKNADKYIGNWSINPASN